MDDVTQKSKREKTKELLEALEQGTKELFTSGRYQQYLDTMAKFHHYSSRNIQLILTQVPEATLVASFNKWTKEFHRRIRKGEKGIAILAPSEQRYESAEIQRDIYGKAVQDENGLPVLQKVMKTRTIFVPVYVFDISQTEGAPLQTLANRLSGSVEDYNAVMDAIRAVSPFPISFSSDMQEDTNGYCSFIEQKIVLREGLSEAQTVKTAVHELAHALLHAPHDGLDRPDRITREVEAESTAYVVCSHLGLDTGDYSFGYIAIWSADKELKQLRASLDTIQRSADKIIRQIDDRLDALRRAVDLRRGNEILDSVKFDGEIDLDREKTPNYAKRPIREQLAEAQAESQQRERARREALNLESQKNQERRQ